jgi:hypothetical protein
MSSQEVKQALGGSQEVKKALETVLHHLEQEGIGHIAQLEMAKVAFLPFPSEVKNAFGTVLDYLQQKRIADIGSLKMWQVEQLVAPSVRNLPRRGPGSPVGERETWIKLLSNLGVTTRPVRKEEGKRTVSEERRTRTPPGKPGAPEETAARYYYDGYRGNQDYW